MSVYVDPICECSFGSFCHLIGDSEELHSLAGKLGLPKEKGTKNFPPRYLLSAGERILAVRMGAVEVSEESFRVLLLAKSKEWREERAIILQRMLG